MQLRPITVLVSVVGAPGAWTLLKQLKGIDEREIRIVGVDADHQAAGQHLCDTFYPVPKASDETEFVAALRDIIYAEDVDAFLCCSSAEVGVVSRHCEEFDCKTLVSNLPGIAIAEDKRRLYTQLHGIVPVPLWKPLKSDFYRIFGEDETLCVKQRIGKGGRGFRVVQNDFDPMMDLVNLKPSQNITIDHLDLHNLKYREDLPEMIVTEYLDGTHYDCMTLCLDGEALLTTVKTRERTRDGIIMHGELVDSPRHVELCARIVKRLGLSYNIGIQFIGETIIEVNPRPSTFIYAPGFCEPYLAVKLALGEITPDEVRAYQAKVPIGLRMARFFDQVFY